MTNAHAHTFIHTHTHTNVCLFLTTCGWVSWIQIILSLAWLVHCPRTYLNSMCVRMYVDLCYKLKSKTKNGQLPCRAGCSSNFRLWFIWVETTFKRWEHFSLRNPTTHVWSCVVIRPIVEYLAHSTNHQAGPCVSECRMLRIRMQFVVRLKNHRLARVSLGVPHLLRAAHPMFWFICIVWICVSVSVCFVVISSFTLLFATEKHIAKKVKKLIGFNNISQGY